MKLSVSLHNSYNCRKVWQLNVNVQYKLHIHHEAYRVLLPVCTVLTTDNPMCKFCGIVFGCDTNQYYSTLYQLHQYTSIS
jgi:hypothetical protein